MMTPIEEYNFRKEIDPTLDDSVIRRHIAEKFLDLERLEVEAQFEEG